MSARIYFWPAITVLSGLVYPLPSLHGADSGRRVALLIVNETYPSPLKTPSKSAAAIAKELEAMHFDRPRVLPNLGQEEMLIAIKEMALSLRSNDTAFFYFAGHGGISGMHERLLPAHASISELATKGVTVEWIAATLGATPASAVFIIIEACTNSLDGPSDLTVAINWVPERTVVVFPSQERETEDIAESNRLSFFSNSMVGILEQTCLDQRQAFELLRPILGARNQEPIIVNRLTQPFSFWCPNELHDDDPQARVNPVDYLTYRLIRGGDSPSGCAPTDTECHPEESKWANRPVPDFWIGQTEVTVEAFRRVMSKLPESAPTYNPRWLLPRLPVTMISLPQAVAYCQAIGGRLPSELEWEFAARRGFGISVMIHPWLLKARETAHDYANYGSEASTGFTEGRDRWRSAPAPIAWFPPIPETLLFDMAGNVAEWVSPPYAPSPADLDILRGGSWRSSISDLRSSARLPIRGDSRDDSIGFRCVMTSPKL